MKKALSILLSLIMAFYAFSVMPFSAFADTYKGIELDETKFYFDTSTTGWTLGTNDKIAFYITSDKYGEEMPYGAKKLCGTLCESGSEEGVWEYDPAAKGIEIEDGVQYKIQFYNTGDSDSELTYPLYFDSNCLGHVAVCDGTEYENPTDFSQFILAAFWNDLDSSVYGPMLAITSSVSVVGTCLKDNETKLDMFENFISVAGDTGATGLENAREYVVELGTKTEQQLIDDLGTALGLTKQDVYDAFNENSVETTWDYTISTLPGDVEIALKCGDSVYYYYTDNGETLTLSGTGDMYSWDNADNKSPFNGDEDICNVIIGDGVTGIGDYAFTGCTNLFRAAIPESVNAIGEGAFASSYVDEIVIPDGVETLEENVFSGCTNLNQLYIPSSVTAIKKGAFKDAPLSKEVFLGASGDDWSAVTTDETDNETLLNAEKYFGIPGAFDGFKAADINAVNYKENESRSILVTIENNHINEKITLNVFNYKGETVCSKEVTVTAYMSNRDFSVAEWTPPYLKSGEYTVFAYGILDGYKDNTEKDGKQYLYYGLGAFTVFPTESSTYTISNYAELKIFANMVNGTGAYAANGPCTGMNGVLTEDITATDKEWTPIGNSDNRYTGVFDGDGHTITGLSNKDASETPKYAGLFGYADSNSVIQNVCMAGADMKANSSIGAIAGMNYEGTITNCCNTGEVSGDAVDVGGIVGDSLNGLLQNCYNTGAVTNIHESANVGGITGYNNSNGSKILNCYNTGAVTGTGEDSAVGGIVGCNNRAEINSCYNTGSVSDSNYKGGIVGDAYGSDKIKNCYYDKNLCGDIGAVQGADNVANKVKGLTTAEMTGTMALDNMTFVYDTGETSPWLVKAYSADETDGKYYRYYPHLKGFKYDVTGDAADWPAKIETAVTWNEPESYKYTGSDIKPVVTKITIGGKVLDSSDYTVSYQQKTDDTWKPATEARNAGAYKAIITFTADEHGNIEKAFKISPKTVTADMIEPFTAEYTYNGSVHTPAVTLKDGETVLEKDKDYTVAYSDTVNVARDEGGNVIAGAKVTVTGKGNYTGKAVSTFTINPKAVTIEANNSAKVYDGTPLTNGSFTHSALETGDMHDFTVVMTQGSTITDVGSVDNVIATVDGVSVTPGTATPVGNYTVTAANGTLEIIQAKAVVTISGHNNTSVFDGGEHSVSGYDFASTNPLFTEDDVYFSGNALAKRTDFGKTNMGLLDSQFLNTNNNFSVTFNVTDGYQQIVPKQINESTDVTLDGSTYNGTAKTLAVKLGDKVLASGADYSVAVKNADGAAVSEIISAGEYTVTVTGKGNYTGSVTKSFTVSPAKITVTAEDKESNHGTDLLPLTYKIDGAYVNGDELGITLNADIDNTKPGAYTITPSWNNNSNYTATLVDGTYTVGDEPHYYGTQGDERFTCTVCGEVDETLKAQAEAADKEAADTAAAKAVTDMINALPEKEEITTADEAAIKKARKAYDSLTDDQKAKVAPETVNKLTEAEKALAEEKAEEATAAQEKAKAEFIAGVDGTSTDSSIIVKWGKVNGAKRYVIYAAYCDKNHKYKYKKIKTVSGKVTKYEIKKLYGKKLNPKRNVKVYIVAQKKKNGKWKKIFKTPTFHIAGAQSKCSNVKKITVKKAKFSLKKGKTAKIKAKLVLVDRNKKAVNHVRKLRYKSTNTAVVKVTKSGKIKAVGKGTATVFVYSNNGTAKAIKVTVK